MIQINIKRNYIFLHFMQFNEQMLLFISVEDDIQKLSFANVFHNGAFKNFAIFSGKHLCWNNCTKKGLQLRFFAKNIAKFYEQLFYRIPPVAVSRYLNYFLIFSSCYVHQ